MDASTCTDVMCTCMFYFTNLHATVPSYIDEKEYSTALVDKAGADCNWIRKYCGDTQLGTWAKQECALTCS